MKRLFAFAALAVWVLAVGTASGAYYDGQNDGSSWENAYVIESSADLVLMSDRVNAGTEPYGKYYKLSADINLASIAGWNHIGTNNGFRGHFDGQNHTITLSADKGSLFDAIITEEDTIAVRNLNIIGSAIGSYGIGSSAIATEFNSGIIENCNFMGSISTTERPTTFLANIYEASPSGGIVKNMYGGTISNCTVSADISSTSSDAGGIVGRMSGGVIENCTVNDGTTITASGYAGGIAGYASGDVTFSGNTWPAGYPQAGNSSSDILAQIATTLGATPVRVPDSAFTSASPVTSSDTASDRQYAASHDMFIAVAISPMASLADGAYYHPVTFSTLPSDRTLATSADFSFYPNGLGANMTSAYVAVFNASGDEVTEPSSVLGKEGYIAFIIENGSIRGTS